MIETSIIIGTIGLMFSFFVAPVQLIKTIKTKKTKDLSILTYIFLLLTCACYLVRAIVIMEWIFIISNGVGVLLTAWQLILILKYNNEVCI